MAAQDLLVREDRIETAEDLRAMMRRAELAVADLRGRGPSQALDLLFTLDAIEEATPRLEAQYGVNLKPERTRLQTIENILRSRSGLLVREAGAARLVEERERQQPPEDHWWWYLDRMVADRRAYQMRRWATRGAIIAGVLLLALVAYNLFLAPSPEQQALSERLSEGESLLLQGDFEAARDQYQAAVALDPTDAGARMYLAVVYEELGQVDAATAEFAEVHQLLPDSADYYSTLSLIYYRMAVGGADTVGKAEVAARSALGADDSSAMAHFALASVFELQGDNQGAIQEFELASSLSQDASLTVLARMRMGMLMQSPGNSMSSPGMGGMGF